MFCACTLLPAFFALSANRCEAIREIKAGGGSGPLPPFPVKVICPCCTHGSGTRSLHRQWTSPPPPFSSRPRVLVGQRVDEEPIPALRFTCAVPLTSCVGMLGYRYVRVNATKKSVQMVELTSVCCFGYLLFFQTVVGFDLNTFLQLFLIATLIFTLRVVSRAA